MHTPLIRELTVVPGKDSRSAASRKLSALKYAAPTVSAGIGVYRPFVFAARTNCSALEVSPLAIHCALPLAPAMSLQLVYP